MALRTLRCAIERIAEWHPRLFLEPHIVACAAVLDCYSDSPGKLEKATVLEISGTETLSELGRRHREKVVQAMANPFGWDACVVVCAFSARGHRIRFTRHRLEEPARGSNEA